MTLTLLKANNRWWTRKEGSYPFHLLLSNLCIMVKHFQFFWINLHNINLSFLSCNWRLFMISVIVSFLFDHLYNCLACICNLRNKKTRGFFTCCYNPYFVTKIGLKFDKFYDIFENLKVLELLLREAFSSLLSHSTIDKKIIVPIFLDFCICIATPLNFYS